jgi:signal transduction histidine kinase
LAIFVINWVLFVAALLAAIVSLVFRWRSAGIEVRQQIKWLVYILGLLVALRVIDWVIGGIIDETEYVFSFEVYIRYAQAFLLVAMVVVLGFAVLKYRLYDIDVIINRTLVYGALTVIIVASYVILVAGIGALLPLQNNLFLSLVATGVIALLFNPLRLRLQRGVNRLMFGERDDPYDVLSRLGQLLSRSSAPEETLYTVVETVAGALKLPYVAIQLEQHGDYRTRAEAGVKAAGLVELPLIHQNESVGKLVVSPRSPGASFNPKDRQLLEDIAHQAGAVAQSVRLTDALQRFRQKLVAAREEERRRLRRDLHDGLGPTLASHTLKLDLAMELISTEPAAAVAQLQDLHRQTQDIVADIRRLVHQLRPPTLDDLGLLGAVRAHIQHSERAGKQPQFTVEAPPSGLPSLSAALELAAYRITMEAVTNVLRHAKAKNCRVQYRIQNGFSQKRLQLQVIDDGAGLPEGVPPGVGMNSMRERAEELGGWVVIESLEAGGARVRAELPMSEESVP